MEQNKIEALLHKTIETWGTRAQLEMAQEEATELALAVRRHIRKNDPISFEALAGEIADVEIMISQMKIMMSSIIPLVEDIKIQKLQRLERRIDQQKFEDL